MATFILLVNFTDQGIRNLKDSIARADAFKDMAKKAGVTVKDIYWTLGQTDIVAFCEAPDDETMTAVSLSLASKGNVRPTTMRAFSLDEARKIMAKVA